MFRTALSALFQSLPAEAAQAHCDGPCGVYDPASARVAAEAVLSMTKKLKGMEAPAAGDAAALATYNNTFSRYVAIKEEEATKAKKELMILWTDYFKPEHLATFPDLHDTFWKAAKLCSYVKVEVNLAHAEEMMETIEKIHNIFWATKGREVPYYTAS